MYFGNRDFPFFTWFFTTFNLLLSTASFLLVFEAEKINVTIRMAIDCLCRLENDILQEKLEILRNNLKNNANSQEQTHQIIKEIDLIQKNKKLLIEKYSNA